MTGCKDDEDGGSSGLTLMTYNILNGAGVETLYPGNREWAEERGYSGNRLPQVLDVVKSVSPNILGVQEAHQWDLGEPAVAETVAQELGMHYFLARSGNSGSGYAHVVLFSTHPIVSAEGFTSQFTRAALHAEIQLDGNQILHVFVVHLDSTSSAVRQQECRFLVSQMAPHIDSATVLMGDMNSIDGQPESDILRNAGWRYLAGPGTYGGWALDQFWASPSLADRITQQPHIPGSATVEVSDHLPLVMGATVP